MLNATRKQQSIFGIELKDWVIVLILTFPVMGTLFPFDTYMASSPGNAGGEGVQVSRSTTIILALILLYVGILLASKPGRTLKSLLRNWPVFLYLGWTFFTSSYAFEPGGSFNRTGRMLVFALFAIYVVEFLDLKTRSRVIWVAMLFSCCVSLLFIIALPSLSHMVDLRGSWRGATMHKNVLGGIAGMLLIASLIYWQSGDISRRLCIFASGLATLLLFLSNNVGSVVAVIIILGLVSYLLGFVNRVKSPMFFVIAGVAIFMALGAFVSNSDFVYELLGRDRNMTGRDGVGRFVEMMIDTKPFWGYGHGIWADPGFKDLGRRITGWPVPNAHNAWLDFRVQLGLPGLLIACLMWAVAAKNLLHVIAVRWFHLIAFPTAAYIFLSIRTYAETILTDPSLNEMFWFMFASASLSQAVAMRKAQDRDLKLELDFNAVTRAASSNVGMLPSSARRFGFSPVKRFGAQKV